ncbi:UDP binding domain-containing protein, partial [Dokdonia donghaensis]|uniref:UDP binding domain-containing protein n=1 Tax=Dokdonia donghaensis TaxID=326320 RepID=UPI0035C79224
DYLNTRSEAENRALVTVVNDPMEACDNAHAIAIMTEWDEFLGYDWKTIYDKMFKPAFIFDGRAIFAPSEMQNIGFDMFTIGRG